MNIHVDVHCTHVCCVSATLAGKSRNTPYLCSLLNLVLLSLVNPKTVFWINVGKIVLIYC